MSQFEHAQGAQEGSGRFSFPTVTSAAYADAISGAIRIYEDRNAERSDVWRRSGLRGQAAR